MWIGRVSGMSADSVSSCNGDQSSLHCKPLVLAIDDDDDNLLLIGYALEMFGCKFIAESSSQAALSLAIEHQPDLILLDILLPNLSGFDVVQCLKQDARTAHIPVVAVTALATDDDQRQLMAAGFVAHLSKPYMLEDLEAIVRRYSCLSVSSP